MHRLLTTEAKSWQSMAPTPTIHINEFNERPSLNTNNNIYHNLKDVKLLKRLKNSMEKEFDQEPIEPESHRAIKDFIRGSSPEPESVNHKEDNEIHSEDDLSDTTDGKESLVPIQPTSPIKIRRINDGKSPPRLEAVKENYPKQPLTEEEEIKALEQRYSTAKYLLTRTQPSVSMLDFQLQFLENRVATQKKIKSKSDSTISNFLDEEGILTQSSEGDKTAWSRIMCKFYDANEKYQAKRKRQQDSGEPNSEDENEDEKANNKNQAVLGESKAELKAESKAESKAEDSGESEDSDELDETEESSSDSSSDSSSENSFNSLSNSLSNSSSNSSSNSYSNTLSESDSDSEHSDQEDEHELDRVDVKSKVNIVVGVESKTKDTESNTQPPPKKRRRHV